LVSCLNLCSVKKQMGLLLQKRSHQKLFYLNISDYKEIVMDKGMKKKVCECCGKSFFVLPKDNFRTICKKCYKDVAIALAPQVRYKVC